MVKNLPPMQERWVWSLDKEDALEEERTTYSSILGWRTPQIEELVDNSSVTELDTAEVT